MGNKKPTSQATRSFIHFTLETEHFETLVHFLQVGNSFIAENKEEAKANYYESVRKADEDPGFLEGNYDKLLDISYYENKISRIIYVRAIDNFTTYFKDVLAEIVIKKPEILKSKETERLDFILEHTSIEDLIKSVSEKTIERLFYKGIKDIAKYFKDRLGVDIFKNQSVEDKINILIKQRNLVVHNRGKITKEFFEEFPDKDYKLDFYLDFSFDYIIKINKMLNHFINELDIELAKKFELNEISY